MKTKLPASTWGHAIMHAASLIRIRSTSYHEYSPSQLVLGTQPNISHLRIFGCAVYVPIAPTQRTKMGPQRRIRIYVGFDSPSIIKYLEPMIGDVFTMSTPLHNLYLVHNQIFLIYEFLVVQSMYQLHLHNAPRWVPNVELGFM